MRLLNDEEINAILLQLRELNSNSLDAQMVIKYSHIPHEEVAKAQHQQDLKDFVEWLENGLDLHENEMGYCQIGNHTPYSFVESLKQLVK